MTYGKWRRREDDEKAQPGDRIVSGITDQDHCDRGLDEFDCWVSESLHPSYVDQPVHGIRAGIGCVITEMEIPNGYRILRHHETAVIGDKAYWVTENWEIKEGPVDIVTKPAGTYDYCLRAGRIDRKFFYVRDVDPVVKHKDEHSAMLEFFKTPAGSWKGFKRESKK